MTAGAESAAGTEPTEGTELGSAARALFTGRRGGVSALPFGQLNLSLAVGDAAEAVAANRRLAAKACGLEPASLAWMSQVHGTDVSYVAGQQAGPDVPVADAIYTDVPGLALGVLVADCAPVLLADPARGLVGAAHAGREGMAAGVVPALVAAMTAAGAEPGRMHALIGPAICGRCYEVPDLLQARIAAAVPEARCQTAAGTAGLDIRAGLRAQLVLAGLRHVRTDPRCTAESPGLYSYRRDGSTGRFAGLVWLRS